MKDKRDKLHLLHIRDAIEKIQNYCSKVDYKKFSKGEKDYDAILMQCIVVGEAANNLSDEFREKYSKLPWHKAIALRNYSAHDYFNIKPIIIWDTANEDLPILKTK